MSVADDQYLTDLGVYATRFVKAGQTIGLGTGHAASAFIIALSRKGIAIKGVPTSEESERLARSLGIDVVSLSEAGALTADFDGADEVDQGLNLIKGYGGALVREKIVAASSKKFIVLVGEEKLVRKLGARGRIPIEVLRFALPLVTREVKALGLKPVVRQEQGREFVTDNGNLILDCGVKQITKPARLDQELLAIPGVVGTGLFCGMASMVLVASKSGKVRVLKPR